MQYIMTTVMYILLVPLNDSARKEIIERYEELEKTRSSVLKHIHKEASSNSLYLRHSQKTECKANLERNNESQSSAVWSSEIRPQN